MWIEFFCFLYFEGGVDLFDGLDCLYGVGFLLEMKSWGKVVRYVMIIVGGLVSMGCLVF